MYTNLLQWEALMYPKYSFFFFLNNVQIGLLSPSKHKVWWDKKKTNKQFFFQNYTVFLSYSLDINIKLKWRLQVKERFFL